MALGQLVQGLLRPLVVRPRGYFNFLGKSKRQSKEILLIFLALSFRPERFFPQIRNYLTLSFYSKEISYHWEITPSVFLNNKNFPEFCPVTVLLPESLNTLRILPLRLLFS
jgi:hypothetical protein